MSEPDDIPRFPRLLAVLAFVGLCVLVVAVFAVGVVGRAATRAAAADDGRQIADFQSRLAVLQGRKAGPATDAAAWIVAPTTAVAAAAIQKLAGNIVAAAGGTVREVQVLPPDDSQASQPGPVPVSADFLFETTHAGLRRILMDIVATRPMLKTDALSIQALPQPPGVGTEVPLRVDMKITGYWAKAGA